MKADAADQDQDALEALAGEYVLGTLPADQRAALAARMAHDPRLQRAVDAWEERLLALTRVAQPSTPSPRLWGRIERSLDERAGWFAKPSVAWWQRLRLWQGVSAVGIAASLVLTFLLLVSQAPSPRYLVVLVAPTDQVPGWVVQASDGRALELIPLGQDAVPDGMALQFWTKGSQWPAPVSLGLIKPGEQYRVPASSMPPLEPDQLFELTLEKAGGSPTGRPTGPVKFIGRAVKVI
ncbi:anti-sigma factor [Pseudomonas sp. SWRI59]|uniref:anti-sigma factor n=1 Tax=Pseudomonas TaxID=286 RepID=UPI0016474284|nr:MULTISPECIES: anti-sigma factor [unclassified Pseudomonas]MBC3504569.1 anti-sigma factor [Pseudomonas sp. SWRI59]MBC3508182.1 anti-sigma factor [Pseudomonas sp. SWRI68]UVL01753.1 anti-sigma factor [Pseudomonas sp. B21-047]